MYTLLLVNSFDCSMKGIVQGAVYAEKYVHLFIYLFALINNNILLHAL